VALLVLTAERDAAMQSAIAQERED
jgi:hypothetical protein